MSYPSRAWLACALLCGLGCSGGKSDEIGRELPTRGHDAGEQEAVDSGGEPAFDADDPSLPDAAVDAGVEVVDSGVDAGAVPASDSGADALASDGSFEPSDGSASDAAALSPGALAPRGYLRASDTPFANIDFAYFYLEDFEDHLLNSPGLSNAGGVPSSSFGATLIDSVDGDDGTPTDNRCTKSVDTCDAWWGPGSLTFRFDALALDGLPSHVGGVWTDGEGAVSFEAFGADGGSIYRVGPVSEPGFPDNTVNSSTSEDRFFGAYDPAGISAFTISNTQGGVEIDHVQYGRAR